MTHVIEVTPAELGWTVTAAVFDNPMVFLSGAKAEAAAKELAQKIASYGEGAEVRVILRDGSVGGRFACAPVVELPLAS